MWTKRDKKRVLVGEAILARWTMVVFFIFILFFVACNPIT